MLLQAGAFSGRQLSKVGNQVKKFKVYNYGGGGIKGLVTVTKKIDGVRLHVENGQYRSRAGKRLYNLPEGIKDGIYEIYRKNFKETIQVVRASESERSPIHIEEIYSLSPVDSRLYYDKCLDPREELVQEMLDEVVALGYEGLVLHTESKMLKVKKHYTEDVRVIGVVPGKGKYEGMMGALMTGCGKVGTGFDDKERKEFFTQDMVGKTIEVEFMEKTAGSKFRHPRFVRLREDK